MDKSKLTIASVKLTSGGMKGIEVEYLLPSVKGNVQFFDIYKSKRKAPIHSELEDCFTWLKGHMLDICGYTIEKEEREYWLGQLSMTGVKYGDKGIVLLGDLLILGGTRVLKLETPLITDEVEYPDFGKLKSIIEGIYAETKEYMAGKKVMSDEQIVARFNAKNEDFDVVAFTKMSKKEQRDIATKILEEQGCMVFHNDEIEVDADAPGEVIDTTTELKKEEPAAVQVVAETKKTTKAKAVKEKKEEDIPQVDPLAFDALEIEDEDFVLPIAKAVKK